jgi:PAS domain S-box-containing protein
LRISILLLGLFSPKGSGVRLLTDTTLAALLDAAPEALLSFDGAGFIVMANIQTELLFGYARGDLIGKPVSRLIPMNVQGLPWRTTGSLMAGRGRDGNEFQVEISLSTISTDLGPVITATIRDVSARIELEEERVRVKTEAERVRLEAEVELGIAEGEKTEAERVRLEAEAELVKAKGEKTVAERVRLEAAAELVIADGEKTEAERVRLAAAAELIIADSEKTEAERVRLEAEAELVKAKGEKTVAERVRLEAAAELVIADGEKTEAERVRLEAAAELVVADSEKTEAERVRLEAEADLVIAEREKSIAERVRLEVEAERVKAEGEKTVAERVRLEAEAELVKAEGEKTIAERVRLEVEAERIKAEGEKTVAERVRLEAEAELVKAEGEKTIAERVRLEVEAERIQAEGEKTIAERVRLEVEAERIKAEGEKTVAERVRLEAEAELVKAEGEKSIAERVRLEVEAERIKAEGEKTVAERVRLEAEAERIKAEGEKTVAERVRLAAEVQRVKAEVEKTEAERVRLEAEVELKRLEAEFERTEAERARLEAEVEYEHLEGQLHQSQRMESLGQLAGGVAHDFNNLLGVILNYAAFVREELTMAVASADESNWEGSLNDVKQIQLAAERASVLTHQLLAFARREVIQTRALSFNSAITSIEEILRRTIGEQIELTISLEPNLSMVVADPGHIEQIILNLAINARDAMPSGGTLSIETSSKQIADADSTIFGAPPGAYVSVQISDNGTGMAAEVRERAFEPFFTTKPSGEGSGLGLATVYGIVMQSGGFTKISSEEGVGTTISILLPVDKSRVELSEDNGDTNKVKSPTGTETVLIVDDEDGLREVTRRILSRGGYTVITASSGAQAIEIAKTYGSPINLLLTDVVMPKIPGPTLADRVKELVPGIRVLFMSGHAQPVLEAESVIGTEFQLVEKPFDQSILLKSVREVLDADPKDDVATGTSYLEVND